MLVVTLFGALCFQIGNYLVQLIAMQLQRNCLRFQASVTIAMVLSVVSVSFALGVQKIALVWVCNQFAIATMVTPAPTAKALVARLRAMPVTMVFARRIVWQIILTLQRQSIRSAARIHGNVVVIRKMRLRRRSAVFTRIVFTRLLVLIWTM